MSAAWSDTCSSSWDFFSGRGEGATRADRWAVRERRASQVLGGTLARDDDFWRYAESIAAAERPEKRSREVAGLYVPRHSLPREAILRLLEVAAENVDRRYDRTGRAGVGVLRVTTVAGPIAYFPDADGVKGNAFSEPGITVLDLGARLVSRRGAQRCLECEASLPNLRQATLRGAGKAWTERANYCDGCLRGTVGQELAGSRSSNLASILPWHFEAIRKILEDATPQILGAGRED